MRLPIWTAASFIAFLGRADPASAGYNKRMAVIVTAIRLL